MKVNVVEFAESYGRMLNLIRDLYREGKLSEQGFETALKDLVICGRGSAMAMSGDV